MSKFWFSSFLFVVFAVLCQNYVMTETQPGYTVECSHSILSNDHCKVKGIFFITANCSEFWQCEGEKIGYKFFCDDKDVFNGTVCPNSTQATDRKTSEEKACPCNQNVSQEGRYNLPKGPELQTENSTTEKESELPTIPTEKATSAATPATEPSVSTTTMPTSTTLLTSATLPTSSKTTGKSQMTPRVAQSEQKGSGGNEVQPQVMIVSWVILPVLLRLF